MENLFDRDGLCKYWSIAACVEVSDFLLWIFPSFLLAVAKNFSRQFASENHPEK